MLKLIDKIISFISQSIAAIGISAGVALAFTNVVARYVFHSSLTWSSELTMYLFIWSTFFGAVYCFKKDAHISVTVLLGKVSPKIAKSLIIISNSITLIFLLAVSYYGFKYLQFVIELDETSIDLEIPMWIPYLVIPIAFFFSSYEVAKKLINIIKTPANKIKISSEAEELIKENEDIIKTVEKKTGGML